MKCPHCRYTINYLHYHSVIHERGDFDIRNGHEKNDDFDEDIGNTTYFCPDCSKVLMEVDSGNPKSQEKFRKFIKSL